MTPATPATPAEPSKSPPGSPIPAKRWTYVIPVAVVMYMLAFLDRSNVSVILPYMDGDLSLSASDEGMVQGIFFLGPFWAIPAGVLRIEVVAVAMGLINALGNLGGYVGPYLVGWLTESTGTSTTGFGVLAGFLAVAVVLVLVGLRPSAESVTAAPESERASAPATASASAEVFAEEKR